MRKSDHIRIAEAVASIYPKYFSHDVFEKLKYGSRYPDDFHKGIAHHHSRQNDTEANIRVARTHYLSGSLSDSAFHLGIAFHYITDSNCPGSSDRKRHQQFEEMVSYTPIPEVNPQKIETPAQIEESITLVLTRPTPRGSLYRSISVCASLLELTWRSLSEKSERDDSLIEEAKKLMPSKLLMFVIYSLAICMVGLSIWLLYFILKFFVPPVLMLVFIAIVLSMAHLYIDEKRKRVLWILKWYGLK